MRLYNHLVFVDLQTPVVQTTSQPDTRDEIPEDQSESSDDDDQEIQNEDQKPKSDNEDNPLRSRSVSTVSTNVDSSVSLVITVQAVGLCK